MSMTLKAPRPQDTSATDSVPAPPVRQRIDDWFRANSSRPSWLMARWDHAGAPYAFGVVLALLSAGMDDYVSKPVKLDDLSAAIKRWTAVSAATSDASETSAPERGPLTPPTDTLTSVKTLDRTVLTNMHGLDISTEPDLIGQVVTTFLGDAADLLEKLRKASEQGDAVALFRAAHSLKASSSLVGALRLSSVAKQLEAACSKGSLDDVPAYVTHLQSEYERLRPELESVV